MRMKHFGWVLAGVLAAGMPVAVAAEEGAPTSYQPAAEGRAQEAKATIPAGRSFRVRMDHSVHTGRAREGDRVRAILVDDLYADDILVAEAGSDVVGRVVYVASARTTRDKAALELRFDRIEPRGGGNAIPISASVVSNEIEDRARRAERDADIAWTAGGALLGTIIGNQSRDRSSGRRTGAAIGAVTGLIISTQTGSDFTLREGTRLTLQLNRPVRIY